VWGVDPEVAEMALWEDFVLLEVGSAYGRASVRAAIANLEPAGPHASELALFRLACRVSLGHDPAWYRLSEEAARYQGDPLWPALARHIARISTPEDRALLEDAAARPEQRGATDPVVAWTLRFHVRGDLVLRDGAIATLDEICDELSQPRLPLLETMPPEIAIDFD
jgi:hypothetical protein